MPCVHQALTRKNFTGSQDRTLVAEQYSHHECPPPDPAPSSHPVLEVGDSRFIIKSGDSTLIEELRLFSESLKGLPRPEVRFTNKLFQCTAQGRLQPWGWQHQPKRNG